MLRRAALRPLRLAGRSRGVGSLPSYLDTQSTSRQDPRVTDAMLPYMSTRYGNPHSKSHAYGWDAEEATEKAREQVAALINADPKEIFFTSGATESNNLAVKGIASFYGGKKKAREQ